MHSYVFIFTKNGLNEFVRRTISQRCKLSLNVDLGVLSCDANIRIQNVEDDGVCMTIVCRFFKVVYFLQQFPLDWLNTSKTEAPSSTLF